MAKATKQFCISEYMQDIMCYSGQQKVFEEASESIGKLLLIEVNAKQIERVCHYYGERQEQQLSESIQQGSSRENTGEKNYYVMVDGSMVFTREEAWKEMKPGRIFEQNSHMEVSKGRKVILASQYVSHLGGHHAFTQKMEYYLDTIGKKIFIADGAKWIWNWVEAVYPQAVQILDFFHAKEHLCHFAEFLFTDTQQRQLWIDEQTALLLDNAADKVILNSKTIENKKLKKLRDQLIKYYKVNFHRMQYKTFKEKGWLIGSGPIESAHRHVIQQRLKLSGQRWTCKGVQQIANLRTVHKSNNWNIVLDLIKKAA